MKQFILNYIVVGIFLLALLPLQAQQEAQYNLYRYHLNLINPAAVGNQGETYLNMSVRSQWVGVEDAPETQAISLVIPDIGRRLNVGFSVIDDRVFVEKQTQLFLDFSYRLPLGDDRSVYLGIKGGGTAFRLNTSDLSVYQSNLSDPNLINVSSFVPNIGVGAIYYTPRFYFGFSIPRILSTERFREVNGQESRPSDQPHYYFNTGFRFPLFDRLEFTPAAMLSLISGAPSMYVADASFSYNNTVDFGVQCIQHGGLGGTLNINIGDAIQVGYAYITQSGNKANFFSQPTHELLLRIRVGSPKTQETTQQLGEEEVDYQPINERKILPKNKGI